MKISRYYLAPSLTSFGLGSRLDLIIYEDAAGAQGHCYPSCLRSSTHHHDPSAISQNQFGERALPRPIQWPSTVG